jgi:RNA-directed DNA polymerase
MTSPKTTRRTEGRGRPEGNSPGEGKIRTQGRGVLPANLRRVNEAAKRDKRTRFTALLHHVDVAALERAFRRVKRRAAPGVDGETVESYEEDLQERLRELCDRVHRGGYRPQPVRRVYIPKAQGGQRPIGVPALEDKLVQGAVAEVLSAIYEADFLGFSYGFRPGRHPHGALQSLHTAMMTQYVNWVLDADIRSFFDSVDHEWMLRMVAYRVADGRLLRLAAGGRAGRPRVAGDVRGDATEGGDQSAPGEHLSALRARRVGPAVEEEAGARAGHHRALCGRLCATTA